MAAAIDKYDSAAGDIAFCSGEYNYSSSPELPLSELESKKKTDQAERPSDKRADKHVDQREQRAFGAAERNVDASNVNAVQSVNPDRHSGSAGGDQDHSIEIVGFGATVSRKTKLTEKDLAKNLAEDLSKDLSKDQLKESASPNEPYVLKGRVEENAITPQAVLEKIAALPPDKQAQIIGAGIAAYQQELDHQRFRIFVGTVAGVGDGVVGLAEGVEGLGKAVCEVAQFSREVVENDPRAASKAAKAGEVVGQVLVGGVRLWQVTDAYLGDIGATGDYAKPLKDIAWLGQQIDHRWQAMSPEEKSRLTAKLAVENLAGLAVGFGTTKLAKSMKVTEALEQLGADASQLGSGAREKAGKFISNMLDELMPQEMAVTPDGQRIAIQRTPRELPGNVIEPKSPRDTGLFSMSDDLGEASKIPNKGPIANADSIEPSSARIRDSDAEIEAVLSKFVPSEKFLRNLELAVESLDPFEIAHLEKHSTRVQGLRRISDLYPLAARGTAAVFDLKNNTIFVGEEVMQAGSWVRNSDIMFVLRHEFGHAYNVTYFVDRKPISDLREFRKVFDSDLLMLTRDRLRELRLDIEPGEVTSARDEVFAELYAHSTGLNARNQYSQKMKVAFPNCLRYIKEGVFK